MSLGITPIELSKLLVVVFAIVVTRICHLRIEIVMIFLYGTKLENKSESADMYVYRLAEEKALKIGNVSRVLKESAVDCLLHAGQSGSTEEILKWKRYNICQMEQKSIIK